MAKISHQFIVKYRPFDKDETNWTKLKHIEHVQFVPTLLNGWNFVRHCCQKRQQCRSYVRLCRSNIRLCRKNYSTFSIWQCFFDVVAGVDGALWITIAAADTRKLCDYTTRTSVLVILGQKCMRAASRAGPWWVTVSMRRRDRHTDERTSDRYITLSARCDQRNTSMDRQIEEWCS